MMFQVFEKLYDSASSEDKVVIIKAMGNSGAPECLPKLTSIIKRKDQPTFIRKMAIYALRRLAPANPDNVRKTLFWARIM